MRLDSISSLKFVEPAQGAHVVRRKQRRQTRHFKQHSKLKKECEIALYRHDPERFTKALRPRLPSCHSNDNQYQPHQNPPFGDVQRKAVCYDVVRDKRDEIQLHRHLLLQDPLFTDSGFCFTPSEIAFFGASPRRHAPRFHFIAEICGTGAGGACGEEETATTNSSLQTTLKTKKRVRDRALPTRSRTVHKSLAATLTVLSP